MADPSLMDVGKLLWNFAKKAVEYCTGFSVTVVVLLLLYRPDRFHPGVDSAVLTALDVSSAPPNATMTTLRYDLAVDLNFRNSHRRLSNRYLDIIATAFYNDTRLGPTEDAFPTPFRQGPKNTTVLHPTFRGTVTAVSSVAAELERERAAGTVHVRITVSLTLLYKVLFIEHVAFYKYNCWLWFPPPHHAAPTVLDAGTRCWPAK